MAKRNKKNITRSIKTPALASTVAASSNKLNIRKDKYDSILLFIGIAGCMPTLIYAAIAYAPTILHYDANGNIDQRTDGSGITSFVYDALNRIVSETGPIKTQNITYDANGNRLSDGAGTYTYVPTSNRLQTAHGQSVGYDAAGNLTSDGTFTYVYNQAGYMSKVNKGASLVASYGYDYRGLRTKKTIGSTTTLYHYDQAGHLIAESDTLGNILRTYVFRDNMPVAQIESSSGYDVVYYLEVDNLNTPRKARNQAGVIIWQWYSDVYGGGLPDEDPDGDGVLTHINLRFPGQYYDAETGLHYNGTRYYYPALGRYLQSDRIGLAGGVNTYIYVGNNPLNRVDPLGLCATSNPSQNCLNALLVANTDSSALARVNNNWATIQAAADANGISPNLLSAIGIRETGFQNIPQSGGGAGAGVFQIDLGQNPSVTQAQAYNIPYAANFAANMLATNMSTLATSFPNFNSNQLLQATAASYNFGTGNISGNPNTIDVGSTGNNYGSNILNLIFNCFSP